MSNRKKNVDVFNKDIENGGLYQYTMNKLSSVLANGRISESILSSYDFYDKKILDMGCGDGTYTFEFLKYNPASILGTDLANKAIELANDIVKNKKLCNISFQTANVYELKFEEKFDVIILRGVLHHLPDAKKALAGISSLADTFIIMEPNGLNPVLKLLEKCSQYHREHEEQSFSAFTVKGWCESAGMRDIEYKYVNLVPMFCPDWLAKICKFWEPIVEKIPFMRTICCGQYIMVCKK